MISPIIIDLLHAMSRNFDACVSLLLFFFGLLRDYWRLAGFFFAFGKRNGNCDACVVNSLDGLQWGLCRRFWS